MFFTVAISCVAISSPKQSTSFVWGTFYNPTGWHSDGIVFLTGLISSNYMYAGLDGAIHLAEDCANAAVAVPRAIISVIGIGFITTLLFIIAMIYSISDFEAVATTPTGQPIFELWRQATKSAGAATTFTIALSFIGFFAFNAGKQTSSRLTWAFARDDAIFLSKWLRRVHPTMGIPIYAYLFNDFIIIVILCIYLGSTAAFYALIGSGLILQQLSYAIPIVALMTRRRDSKYLPNKGHFNLGVFGWSLNIIAVGWTLLALVVYDLPLFLPVTGSDMSESSSLSLRSRAAGSVFSSQSC
jgi:choline transport protein